METQFPQQVHPKAWISRRSALWQGSARAGLLATLMPLIAACAGYPGPTNETYIPGFGRPLGSIDGVTVYDVSGPPVPIARSGRMIASFPPYAPAVPEGSSGLDNELLAGAGGFIAGRAMKSGEIAAASGDAPEAGAATGLAARTLAEGATAGEEAAVPAAATTTAAGEEGAVAAMTGAETVGAAETVAAAEAAGTGAAAAAGGEAVGAGGLLEAGAIAGGAEVLAGAAIIGGAVYLGYEMFHHHADSNAQK